jgi:hypothetical protein
MLLNTSTPEHQYAAFSKCFVMSTNVRLLHDLTLVDTTESVTYRLIGCVCFISICCIDDRRPCGLTPIHPSRAVPKKKPCHAAGIFPIKPKKGKAHQSCMTIV